jgi:predicted Ser/Thr protein kinase
MQTEPLVHPEPARLSDFVLGKLSPAERQQIEEHLADCAACSQSLREAPDDTLVALLRAGQTEPETGAARPHGSAVVGELSSMPLSSPPPGSMKLNSMPAELRDHPRYRVLRLLGKGGMGSVYLAEHRLMQRQVAVKIIDPHWTTSPTAVERFRREIRAAATLSHPHIVAAYDAEQAGQTQLLAMEYVDGVDLAELVRQRGALSVGEACRYIRQAALGLAHAAQRELVHRDIKPQNLMLAADGNLKILDFGLASLANEVDGGLTAAGSIMGTPDYLAPEQARDAASADTRADIYSLGCTLYFLLTGESPVPQGSAVEKVMAQVEREPSPIGQLRGDVPAGLQTVIARMMKKRPEDRYQTAGEVAAALEPWTGQTAAAVMFPKPAVSSRAAGRRGDRARKIAIGSLLVTTLLLAAIYIQTDKGTLQIESTVDDVQIVVSQEGEDVTVVDLATQSQVRLRSGQYDIALKGDRNDVKLDRDKITLSRFGQAIVEVQTRDNAGKFVSPSVLASFDASDKPITTSGVAVEDGGFQITADKPRVVRLFDVPDPGVDNCLVWYRAQLKTENIEGKAYLEMWARLPGKGEFFSKGFHLALSGDNGWSDYEIPFRFEAGQRPDLIKLNLAIEGTGTVWIKNIELRRTPLP